MCLFQPSAASFTTNPVGGASSLEHDIHTAMSALQDDIVPDLSYTNHPDTYSQRDATGLAAVTNENIAVRNKRCGLLRSVSHKCLEFLMV